MTEQQVPATAQTQPQPSAPPKAPKKKKKKRKIIKTIVWTIVLLLIAAAIAAVLYFFVFKEDEADQGAAMTDVVMIGAIQQMVEGSGMTKAKDSATVSPTAGGTILELFVQQGDFVEAGAPLYTMDDTEAQEAVAAAQKTVEGHQKELQAIYDKAVDLTIAAPHDGNLREAAELKNGDQVSEGMEIATLVNDTRLKLSLYFSYAFENDIKVGQAASVSLPAVMRTVDGEVEAVNKVRFVSPEGAVHFEAVIVIDNPGTLTEGMDAAASLTAADGTPIYPYENGTLKFYETTAITAKASGPVEYTALLNYSDVKAGETLVRLGAEDNDAEIASIEKAMAEAQETLDAAIAKLGEFNAVAPISGTVLSCNLVEGLEVQAGQGITIADTSAMTIEISVDERNIRYVEPGMWVDIDQYGNYFGGIVETVSQVANAENGVSSFPVVVKVDNPDGLLMSNMYVSYSFVASESEGCLTVPVQSVKYVNVPPEMTGVPASEDGTATIVFVKGEEMPENGIAEPDPAWECPEGFWAVPVEVGLADSTRAEVLSGLADGMEVFIGYELMQADSWGY